MSEANKALVRAITDELWNAGRLGRIPDFYTTDFVADYRPIAPLREGHAGIRAMLEGAHAAFSEYHEELHDLIAEGDRVVARFTITGVHSGPWGVLPPTGRRVAFEEIAILRIRDGRVCWQRGIPDNVAALRQLGVLPTPRS